MTVPSVLKCITCDRSYPVEEIRYTCDCGALLEYVHDFSQFGRDGRSWRALFDARLSKRELPYGSGVWRFKELVMPFLPEDQIVSLYEGNTPLYPATAPLRDHFGIQQLFFKHAGMCPTLSFKDYGMTVLASVAHWLDVKGIACASTGDTSASMAAYTAQLASKGLKGVVLLPKGKISFEQLSQPISSGVTTLELDTDFDGCMRIIQEVTDKHPIYLANSKNSSRIEGQKAIAFEIVQQLHWEAPDWIVVPMGNAGNLSAIGKGLFEMKELGIIDRLPRLAAVQSEAANPMYLSYLTGFREFEPIAPKPSVASAIWIGDPVSREKAIRELRRSDGVVEQVSEEELLDAKAKVDASGIYVCPQGGVAAAGMKKLREKGVIKESEHVVVVITAHGGKFSRAAVDYHSDPKSRYGNRPIQLAASLTGVEQALGLG
ncbi:MAG: threonine synthase [Candidatus Latescibacterota bacterium]